MRDQILSEIRRLAALNGGQPPGQKLFVRDTGIGAHQWRGKFWARWGDALVDAGFKPNRWTERLDSNDVLTGIIAACRHYGRLPTRDEIEIYRKSEPSIPSEQAIKRHFGGRQDLIAALARHAAGGEGFADIVAMLPSEPQAPPRRSSGVVSKLGYVYLMKMGAYYKIGATGDLEKRMRKLSAATPELPSFDHFMKTDDPFGLEAYWKRRFKAKQTNGEYFKLTATDVSSFKRLRHF
jgi:hypothetical protein